MITVDQLEVLLRSIPPYFLFGGLSLYIYAWIEKKPERGIYAEILFLLIGLAAIVVLMSGMIPSPQTEGLVADHVERVTKMLILLGITGVLAAVSMVIRLIRKVPWSPLVLIIFALGIYIFFATTKLSKIKFELNRPAPVEQVQ
jgi:uncharacterized membrane protein